MTSRAFVFHSYLNKKRPSACRGVFFTSDTRFYSGSHPRFHPRPFDGQAQGAAPTSASFTFCVLPPIIFPIPRTLSNFSPPVFIAQIPLNRQAQCLFKIVLRLPPQRHNF